VGALGRRCFKIFSAAAPWKLRDFSRARRPTCPTQRVDIMLQLLTAVSRTGNIFALEVLVAGRKMQYHPLRNCIACLFQGYTCWRFAFQPHPEGPITTIAAGITDTILKLGIPLVLRSRLTFRVVNGVSHDVLGHTFLNVAGESITARGLVNGISMIIYCRHRRLVFRSTGASLQNVRVPSGEGLCKSFESQSRLPRLDGGVSIFVIAAVIGHYVRKACANFRAKLLI